MKFFNIYIALIFIVKIFFIILAISHLYYKRKGQENSKTDKKVVYWKDRFEFIFIALMALLLIYLFNPRTDRSVIIDKETKILLYLFGFILILTAKWEVFFKESKWFSTIQKIAK
jgi:L-asparagine transporter-like permease